MAINLTDSLNAATTKGKLGDAKQVYLNGDTKNLQQAYEETSTHFGTLDNRSTQMEKAIQDISATGGASTANAVSYNNSTSKLEAITAQGAIDELAAKNATKAEKAEVTAELEKKFDKESILQESGEAEDKVMSQKAVSTKLNDLENKINSTFINVSHLYPTDGYTNEGVKGGDQYSLEEAIQLFVDKGLDDTLRAAHGLIFVNKETKKWEMWEYPFYTKIGDTYKASMYFRRVLNEDEYKEIINKISILQSGVTREAIQNLQSVNLLKEIVYGFFNDDTGDFLEEEQTPTTTSGTFINMKGIETTDIYIYLSRDFNPNFTKVYVYDENGDYVKNGGIPFDEGTSTEHLRHFIIPKGTTKIFFQFVSEDAVYIKPINTYIPYGVKEDKYEEQISDFYLLGKTLNSIKIDISNLFQSLKQEVFLKAGETYAINSNYKHINELPFKYIDVKGNIVSIVPDTPFTPEYDCYYILNEFINTKDEEAYLTVRQLTKNSSELDSNKIEKEPFSILAKYKRGTIDENTGVITYNENGVERYVAENIPISPVSMIYVFSFIEHICFYDYNKKFIGNGKIVNKNYAYKSPDNAYYMSVQRPAYWDENIGFVKDEQEYSQLGNDTIIALCSANFTRFTTPKPIARNRTLYIVGDSEAARLSGALNLDFLPMCAMTSFGGHSDDMISSNVGVDTRGINLVLKSLKRAKVIIQASTNGDDTPRMRAHILELIKAVREFGANEVWGMSLCVSVNSTLEDLQNNKRYQMQKLAFGGHFIDHLAAVFQMGLYYNLYHPKEFIQPSVGSNVDIYFDDITPFTEFETNPIFGEGLDFYMQYYDNKYDIYTVVSIDRENNKITATLKTNNSDVVPGSKGGQYEEAVSTAVYSGKKITKGFIYNEFDKTNVSQGKLPYNIYADHYVHFGKILAAIMKEMLYTAGAVEVLED